jgi:hypothetical protein
MKIQIRHFGRILDSGKIVFYDYELWENQRYSLKGKEIELVIKEKIRRPSVNQFSYYFGGILGTCLTCEMFSHFNTVEQIHKEVFAPEFLSYQNKVTIGKMSLMRTHVRSLAELSKKETAEFVEKVLMWCEQNEILILPAEQYVEKYYKEVTIKK